MQPRLIWISSIALTSLLTQCQQENETVNPVPEASFSTQGTLEIFKPIQFKNSSQQAQNYKWDFADGTTSTDSDPLHTFQKAGSYRVVLTATGPGGQDTSGVVVKIGSRNLLGMWRCKIRVTQRNPPPTPDVHSTLPDEDVMITAYNINGINFKGVGYGLLSESADQSYYFSVVSGNALYKVADDNLIVSHYSGGQAFPKIVVYNCKRLP